MTMSRGVIVAMVFALEVWAMGRVLTALVARTPRGPASVRLYLADRVDHLPNTSVLAYEDELLVSLAADLPTGRARRVVAGANARTGLERRLEDVASLRAYCSADGAIMLAALVWGGNIACEPAMAVR